MTEIVLFHHAGGLTEGVGAFAQTLRDAGHTVHTPDLFDGRTFGDVRDGVAYADSVGEETFAARAREIVSPMSADLVYGGMSMGVARAAEQVLARPGAKGAFFLYGAIAPSWWDATLARRRTHAGPCDRRRPVARAGRGGGVPRRRTRR